MKCVGPLAIWDKLCSFWPFALWWVLRKGRCVWWGTPLFCIRDPRSCWFLLRYHSGLSNRSGSCFDRQFTFFPTAQWYENFIPDFRIEMTSVNIDSSDLRASAAVFLKEVQGLYGPTAEIANQLPPSCDIWRGSFCKSTSWLLCLSSECNVFLLLLWDLK